MSEQDLPIPLRVLYPSECSYTWNAVRSSPTLEVSFLTRPPMPGPLQIKLPPAVEVALQYSTAATASTESSTFTHTEGVTFSAPEMKPPRGQEVKITRRFVVDMWGDLKVHETAVHADWVVRTVYRPAHTK
jgi:hypothetical protein